MDAFSDIFMYVFLLLRSVYWGFDTGIYKLLFGFEAECKALLLMVLIILCLFLLFFGELSLSLSDKLCHIFILNIPFIAIPIPNTLYLTLIPTNRIQNPTKTIHRIQKLQSNSINNNYSSYTRTLILSP